MYAMAQKKACQGGEEPRGEPGGGGRDGETLLTDAENDIEYLLVGQLGRIGIGGSR